MAFAIAVMARMNGSDPTVAATFVLSRVENERRFRIYFCISIFNLYRFNSAIDCFACFVHVMAPDANTSILRSLILSKEYRILFPMCRLWPLWSSSRHA